MITFDGKIKYLTPRQRKNITDIKFVNVTSIGDNFGKGYPNLKSISADEHLISIGNNFLSECKSLIDVKLPGIVEVGDNFLDYCDSITEVTFNKLVKFGKCFMKMCNSLTSVIIPKVTECPHHNFLYGLKNLKYVDVSSMVTVHTNFVRECFNLETIICPNIQNVGCYFLFYDTSLKSISLPNLINMGRHFMSGCSSLTTFVIPNSVTFIRDYFLNNCTNLKTITISNNVDTIGDSFLLNCKGLKDLEIRSPLVDIRESFLKGTNLDSVTILSTTKLKDVGCCTERYNGPKRNLITYPLELNTNINLKRFYLHHLIVSNVKKITIISDCVGMHTKSAA